MPSKSRTRTNCESLQRICCAMNIWLKMRLIFDRGPVVMLTSERRISKNYILNALMTSVDFRCCHGLSFDIAHTISRVCADIRYSFEREKNCTVVRHKLVIYGNSILCVIWNLLNSYLQSFATMNTHHSDSLQPPVRGDGKKTHILHWNVNVTF